MANVVSIFEDRLNVGHQDRPVMMDFFISGSTILAEPYEFIEPYEFMQKIKTCIKTVRNCGASVNYIFFSPDIWNLTSITIEDFTCNVIQLKRLYNAKLNIYRIVVSNVDLTEFLSGIEPIFTVEVINT